MMTEINRCLTWYYIIKPYVSDTHTRTLTTTHFTLIGFDGFLEGGWEAIMK